jgi:hypothetical protein
MQRLLCSVRWRIDEGVGVECKIAVEVVLQDLHDSLIMSDSSVIEGRFERQEQLHSVPS